MPYENILIDEDYLSRPFRLGRQAGRELIYNIMGSENEEEIYNVLRDEVPDVYQYLVLESLEAEPLGDGVWKGIARYVRLDEQNEYTFDTGGATTKITNSLETKGIHARPGTTAPIFYGAIGVSEDKVEGCEIITPVFNFTETHYIDDAIVDAGYKLVLFNLTGRVNAGSFKGLAAGECLFQGASGTKRGDERWAITYRFACSPNVSGLTVGQITGIDKKGWEYLWVRYAEFEDLPAYAIVKRPQAAYVERVYEEGDFGQLLIGV